MQSVIQQLQQAIQKESGIHVNSISRCRELSAWLHARQVYVSYSTISRLYGLSKNVHKTNSSTLDLLSKSIGFSNLEHFLAQSNETVPNTVLLAKAKMHLKLLQHQNNPQEAVRFFVELLPQNPLLYGDTAATLAQFLLNGDRKNNDALKQLAMSKEGRSYFYQFFVDEDDCSGMFQLSLDQFFRAHCDSLPEITFSGLYLLRKKILQKPASHPEVKQQLDELKKKKGHLNNLHLYSRWTEVNALIRYAKNGKTNPEWVAGQTAEIIEKIESCTSRNEIIAAIGRWNRALLLTGAFECGGIPDAWYKISNTEMMYGFQDLEFQSATYGLLSRQKDMVISKSAIPFNHWENAILTSSLFLQEPEYVRQHRVFFSKKLGVDELFLRNLFK